MAKICQGSVQPLTACIPERQACPFTHSALPHGHGMEQTLHWEPAHVMILSVIAMPMVVQIGQVWMPTTMAPAAPTPFPMSRYHFCAYRQASLSVGYGQLLLACCMPIPCLQGWTCVLVCTHHGSTDE